MKNLLISVPQIVAVLPIGSEVDEYKNDDFYFSHQILGRMIRVDHVADYKKPKDKDEEDDLTKRLHEDGCGPEMAARLAATPDDAGSEPDEKKIKKGLRECEGQVSAYIDLRRCKTVPVNPTHNRKI